MISLPEELHRSLNFFNEAYPGVLTTSSLVNIDDLGHVHSLDCSVKVRNPPVEVSFLTEQFAGFCPSCFYRVSFNGVYKSLLDGANRLILARPGTLEHIAAATWVSSRFLGSSRHEFFRPTKELNPTLEESLTALAQLEPFVWSPPEEEGSWFLLPPGWENPHSFPGFTEPVKLVLLKNLYAVVLSSSSQTPTFSILLGSRIPSDTFEVLEAALLLCSENITGRHSVRSQAALGPQLLETARLLAQV